MRDRLAGGASTAPGPALNQTSSIDYSEEPPMRRAATTFLAFLALSGCTRGEARARFQDGIHAARFPCHSPDLHFFGYRFRVVLKGEYGDGDMCWNMSTRQWSLRILAGATLSLL